MKTIIIKETSINCGFSDCDMSEMLDKLTEDFSSENFIPYTVVGDKRMFTLLPASLVESGALDEDELGQFLYRRSIGGPETTFTMDDIVFQVENCDAVSNPKRGRIDGIIEICEAHGVDEETAQAIAGEVISIL